MIKCKNISKSYNGKDILNNISFYLSKNKKEVEKWKIL